MPVGIDYTAIGPTARMIGIEAGPAEFADLKTMEAEAIRVFGARRKTK